MSLSSVDRHQIFVRLSEAIGQQEAQTLLDQFPATPDADPVTVARLDRAEARLDVRIGQVEARLNARIDQVEARLDHRISQVEASLGARIDQVEAGLDRRIDALEAKLDHARVEIVGELHRALRQQTILLMTTVLAIVGFAASVAALG